MKTVLYLARKKRLLALSALFGLALFAAMFSGEVRGEKVISRACFKDVCFKLEIARTPQERIKGLMFRRDLGADQGMFFIFEKKGRHDFWMKNTFLPLDIIWIADDSGKVVDIWENAAPCLEDSCPSFEPKADADYVLEINGGIARKIGLGVGDTVVLSKDEVRGPGGN
jgi:uncharacterized protein